MVMAIAFEVTAATALPYFAGIEPGLFFEDTFPFGAGVGQVAGLFAAGVFFDCVFAAGFFGATQALTICRIRFPQPLSSAFWLDGSSWWFSDVWSV